MGIKQLVLRPGYMGTTTLGFLSFYRVSLQEEDLEIEDALRKLGSVFYEITLHEHMSKRSSKGKCPHCDKPTDTIGRFHMEDTIRYFHQTFMKNTSQFQAQIFDKTGWACSFHPGLPTARVERADQILTDFGWGGEPFEPAVENWERYIFM